METPLPFWNVCNITHIRTLQLTKNKSDRLRYVVKSKAIPVTGRSKPWTMDSLYVFKRKLFRNTRHTVTFGMKL
jgi:hypothetical protein